jgi:hypothetical protein
MLVQISVYQSLITPVASDVLMIRTGDKNSSQVQQTCLKSTVWGLNEYITALKPEISNSGAIAACITDIQVPNKRQLG